ncbi:hypothetical protein ACLF3G_15255 [Falsiroseomonas sp. HC035]|uniref:hypothetical protein n=1 Tax=Falsiroseomonas sp. HC035 TaxID=3390999 RepID=UPI003D31ECAD
MTRSRLSALALTFAAGVAATPVVADDHTTFHHLEVTSAARPDCRTGMLLNLPQSWQVGDGAVVLLTMRPLRDAGYDLLVSALLSEHAAVLELVPLRCDNSHGEHASAMDSALGALEAMAQTLGAGLVVAIGYGRGGAAVLDVLHQPEAGLPDPDRPHYVAAVALGGGPPVFALGHPMPAWEQAPSRIALLCRALAALVGGMGTRSGVAAETCHAVVADRIAPARAAQAATTRP